MMLDAPRRKDGTFHARGYGEVRRATTTRQTVKKLITEGRTLVEIGRIIGCSGSAVWDIKRSLIKSGELPDTSPPITLPRVSILHSDIETTRADYRFGKAWMSGA